MVSSVRTNVLVYMPIISSKTKKVKGAITCFAENFYKLFLIFLCISTKALKGVFQEITKRRLTMADKCVLMVETEEDV